MFLIIAFFLGLNDHPIAMGVCLLLAYFNGTKDPGICLMMALGLCISQVVGMNAEVTGIAALFVFLHYINRDEKALAAPFVFFGARHKAEPVLTASAGPGAVIEGEFTHVPQAPIKAPVRRTRGNGAHPDSDISL